ncbi:S8 family serine peptidase [Nodosilinea sp. P-1105]|uniref:S8 family serine peptidase n=1 Tax=Nodosilinea sp. P-1105 TaxID=2546229 RepID=UPI00146A3A49|nr:S8 family serine peptidase [Nodosilinea sp. P-1105]NMF86195.1 peptidase S8 and S53 subtilisin kexin sedolisin [Nodosilinea sp. P-1105]
MVSGIGIDAVSQDAGASLSRTATLDSISQLVPLDPLYAGGLSTLSSHGLSTGMDLAGSDAWFEAFLPAPPAANGPGMITIGDWLTQLGLSASDLATRLDAPSDAPLDRDSLTGLSTTAKILGSQLGVDFRDLGTLLGPRSYAGDGDLPLPLQAYRFSVNSSSSLDLSFQGLVEDSQLWLFEGLARDNPPDTLAQVLEQSIWFADTPSGLSLDSLAAGDYYALVATPPVDHTLSIEVSPLGGIDHIKGSLRADQFEFAPTSAYTVFSGKGNVDFGQGAFDLIDLSQFSIDDVSHWNLATASGGGMLYDPGNGLRLFDAISLNDGSHILFEGIDRLTFADSQVDLAIVPDDSLFLDQWNLHMLGVHNAWRFTQGSSDVLIGIQDTGLAVDADGNFHPDLRPTLTIPNNIDDTFVDPRNDVASFHGTSVQGIIAANSDRGLTASAPAMAPPISMSGIDWQSDVMHINTFGDDGITLAEAAEILVAQAENTGRPVIINMSLEVPGAELGAIPELEALMAQTQDSALFVIATGNDGVDSLSYPASLATLYDNVIAGGAVWGLRDVFGNPTEPGTRIAYDNFYGSNFGEGLTLMAPSEVITTQAIANSAGQIIFDYNPTFLGTSAAVPHITGVASLVWSIDPSLGATQVRQIMTSTAYDLGDAFEYGSGLVNADAAVRRALALANPVSHWSPLPGNATSTMKQP